MRDLYFKTPADFEELFSKQNRKIADMMVESIGEGIEFQKKTVTLFTIKLVMMNSSMKLIYQDLNGKEL